VPPANRLEASVGDRRGQHAIRINDRWRMCFVWSDGNAHQVEIVACHRSPPQPASRRDPVEEFLKPMDLSRTALAKAIGVPPRRINEIVLGKRTVTADTDLRLAGYFGVSEGFFPGLQTDHDLMARRRQIGEALRAIRPRAA
jgi:addiction module HigA family antidote